MAKVKVTDLRSGSSLIVDTSDSCAIYEIFNHFGGLEDFCVEEVDDDDETE